MIKLQAGPCAWRVSVTILPFLHVDHPPFNHILSSPNAFSTCIHAITRYRVAAAGQWTRTTIAYMDHIVRHLLWDSFECRRSSILPYSTFNPLQYEDEKPTLLDLTPSMSTTHPGLFINISHQMLFKYLGLAICRHCFARSAYLSARSAMSSRAGVDKKLVSIDR